MRNTLSHSRCIIGDVREVLPTLEAGSVQMCVTFSYCAGVIDSDGYIGIKKNTYSMRIVKDSTQPTYSERVGVKQIEEQAVNLLYSLFGGTLRLEKRAKGKPLYMWQVTDRKAVACLETVLPFLRIKREQAFNALRLREIKEESKKLRVAIGRGHVGSAYRTKEHSMIMEDLYERAKFLNGRQ